MLFKKLFNIFAQKSCGSYARFSNFSNFYACKLILTIFGLDSSHLHLFYRIFCLFVCLQHQCSFPAGFVLKSCGSYAISFNFYACKLILTIFGMDSSHLHLFCRIFFLLFTNMKEMFCYPAKFLLLTNQAHALADRANDCGQAQNMTMPRHHNKSLRKLSNWN